MIAPSLLQQLELLVGQAIHKVSTVNGGSINRVYCLQTAATKYLLKVNNQRAYPAMFQREQEGLQAIAGTQTIATPKVLYRGEVQDDSYLLLEWIPTINATQLALKLLGEKLAAMHRHTATNFGFQTDNYMGSLTQSNRHHNNWSDFFIHERLKPMVKLATDHSELSLKDADHFEKLYQKLPGLFNEEPPALIHGDLWGGNYLIAANGTPYLIDPAVSYGNREFDLAMTTLFGGFSRDFYKAYHSAYPLQPGWQQRISLWNLYPLLIHVNLFGGNYAGQVRQCLARYI